MTEIAHALTRSTWLGRCQIAKFFQLLSARYEKGGAGVPNRGFSELAEVFGDPVIATALLEHL